MRQLCEKIYEINEENLCLWLTTREIFAGGESVRKRLTTAEVSFLCDPLIFAFWETVMLYFSQNPVQYITYSHLHDTTSFFRF